MEEKKKFDTNSLIGFLLIGAILLFMLNRNQKNIENEDKEQAGTEQVDKDSTIVSSTAETKDSTAAKTAQVDSLAQAAQKEKLGVFSYSAGIASGENSTTIIENNLLKIEVRNKGGEPSEVTLKQVFDRDSLPIQIIKGGNASMGLKFLTTENKTISTQDLIFEPEVHKSGENTVLSMKAKVSEDEYLEYLYTLKPNDYMMDFTIQSKGLDRVINQAGDVDLNWSLDAYRQDQSIDFEKRYTETIWHYEGNKNSSRSRDGDKDAKDIHWVAFRQHFFTSILINDSNFENGNMSIKDISKDEEVDTIFTKNFGSTLKLKLKNGNLQENMNLYYGPSDYEILRTYKKDLDEIVPMGWGIFGWINKYIFIPVLSFFMQFLPAGIAIIILTIVVKLLLSPVQYKQYLSQAKQKVLRPEIDEIKEKYKDDKMKQQQETMKLNQKAGINPASGCLVGLIQIPIFYALFRLFPSAFNLRHKSFLWADDLASYDVIAELPFKIPFYGDHVSLFPLLASGAIFVYMMLTTGQNMNNMPQQPGMPNMKFIMYLSPIFMLFFFNSYPSGLSVYYMTSNLISIGIVLVIKGYFIDEDKIHSKIQENKKKPRKQNRFQRKMQEMMEEAERQKKAQR